MRDDDWGSIGEAGESLQIAIATVVAYLRRAYRGPIAFYIAGLKLAVMAVSVDLAAGFTVPPTLDRARLSPPQGAKSEKAEIFIIPYASSAGLRGEGQQLWDFTGGCGCNALEAWYLEVRADHGRALGAEERYRLAAHPLVSHRWLQTVIAAVMPTRIQLELSFSGGYPGMAVPGDVLQRPTLSTEIPDRWRQRRRCEHF